MMIALIVSLLAQGAVLAGDHPCRTDARKLCAGVQPGGGRVLACLKAHEAQVSAECKAKGMTLREEREGREDGDDRGKKHGGDGERGKKHGGEDQDDDGDRKHDDDGDRKHGDDHDQGNGRAEEERGDRRAAEDQRAAGERRREGKHAKPKEALQACRDDVDKLCKAVKPGGGRLATCLKAHQAQLSSACTDDLQWVKK